MEQKKKEPETKNINIEYFRLKFSVYVDVLNPFLHTLGKIKTNI